MTHESNAELVAGRLMIFPPTGAIYVSGTCVRIAQSLYLTARHVFEDFMNRFPSEEGRDFCPECWIVHIRPGPTYAVWRANRVWFSIHSDMAVIHAIPHNDVAARWKNAPSVRLEMLPPNVGQRVSGFGFHQQSGSIELDSDGTRQIQISARGAATVGEVLEIHQERRDRSRLNFPCFQVNARFDGGMSGGPVFTDTGTVCGIVCSSLPAQVLGEEHASYVTTLWPIMGIGIDINRQTGEVSNCSYPLLELARERIIVANGWQGLVVEGKSPLTTVSLKNM